MVARSLFSSLFPARTHRKRGTHRKGLTLIEALVTLGIIAVTAGVTVPLYRSYQVRSDLDTAVEQTVQALHRAQVLSRASQGDSAWGFDVRRGILFKGDGYIVSDATFAEDYPVPPSVSVSGLLEVVFERVTGDPRQSGAIIFTADNGEQQTITIASDGSITVSEIETIVGDIGQGSSQSSQQSAATSYAACLSNDCIGSAPGGTPLLCLDGSVSGPSCDRLADGRCGWTWHDCPVASSSDASASSADAQASSAAASIASTPTSQASCGNGTCDQGETQATCSADCSVVTPSSSSVPSSLASSHSSAASSLAPCDDRFTLNTDSSLLTNGTEDAAVQVLSSSVTITTGGSTKPSAATVVVSVSTDNGTTWQSLFKGLGITSGAQDSVTNLPAGTRLLFKVNGRSGWLFNQTFQSNDGLGHLLFLRKGDALPNYDAFKKIKKLPSYLQALLDDDGRVNIGDSEVLILTELGALWGGSVDFQDAVLRVSFTSAPGSCVTSASDVRFKVLFDRIENSGTGNASRTVHVGKFGTAFSESQWIPLTIGGTDVVDAQPLLEDVLGLAVDRQSGGVFRVLLPSTHPGSKEIVDARITLNGALIESVTNDIGSNATEDLFDGIVNDGSSGDEVTISDDRSSVLFQARASAENDAIFIHWRRGSVSSSSVSSSTADTSASSIASSGDLSDETSTDGAEPDICAASFERDSRGRIVLREQADVSFRVLGSHATYGDGGPQIHVRMNVSFDGGTTWQSLFHYLDIAAGDSQTFLNIPANSVIAVSAEGRYGWLFRRIAKLGDEEARIRTFVPGDTLPTLGILTSTYRLQPFLRDLIEDGKFKRLQKRYILFTTELQDFGVGTDYQDAVLIVSVTKSTAGGQCGTTTTTSSSASVTHSSAASSQNSTTSQSSVGIEGTGAPVTICHFPPGNPKNMQTLTIGQSAWTAHSAHGDRLGACEGDDDGDGVLNKSDLCPGTYMPESVPTEYMLFNRFALQTTSGIFTTGPQKRVSSYSLADTGGCSCGQIVDVAESKKTYWIGQYPVLLSQLQSLFPFYTEGARQFGCGQTLLDVVKASVVGQ